jgi:hypothetical protein
MIVLKSLGAVGAGFMTMVVLILVSTPLVVRLMLADSAQPPTPAYLTVNLLTGFAFAGVGGWITAHLAPAAPLWHAAGLATIVLILGVATAAQGGAVRAGQPQWYAWTLPFIGAAGALLGGWW